MRLRARAKWLGARASRSSPKRQRAPMAEGAFLRAPPGARAHPSLRARHRGVHCGCQRGRSRRGPARDVGSGSARAAAEGAVGRGDRPPATREPFGRLPPPPAPPLPRG